MILYKSNILPTRNKKNNIYEGEFCHTKEITMFCVGFRYLLNFLADFCEKLLSCSVCECGQEISIDQK